MKRINYIEIKIIKGNAFRLINMCSKSEIPVWDIKESDEGIYVKVLRHNYLRMKKLLKKCGVRTKIINKHDYIYVFNRYRHNISIMAGIIIAFAVSFVSSLFLWGISITGNVCMSDEEILKQLKMTGVLAGVRKSKLDLEKIETDLKDKYQEISWVNVMLSGNILEITIKEANEDINPYVENNENIVSNYDGRVVSILTRAGTPRVKADDIVSKGDVLIESNVYIPDDYEENIYSKPSRCDGTVMIETTIKCRFTKECVESKKVYTGDIKRVFTIGISGKEFSVKTFGRMKNFDLCEIDGDFKLFGRIELPISYRYSELKEYKLSDYEVDVDEANEYFEEKFKVFLKSLSQNEVQIKDYRVNIDTVGENYIFDAEIDVIIPADYVCREAGYLDE